MRCGAVRCGADEQPCLQQQQVRREQECMHPSNAKRIALSSSGQASLSPPQKGGSLPSEEKSNAMQCGAVRCGAVRFGAGAGAPPSPPRGVELKMQKFAQNLPAFPSCHEHIKPYCIPRNYVRNVCADEYYVVNIFSIAVQLQKQY